MSDVYHDVELPYPDAKVANKLSIGGPCYYLLPGVEDGNGENDANNNTTMMAQTLILWSVVPNKQELCFNVWKGTSMASIFILWQ